MKWLLLWVIILSNLSLLEANPAEKLVNELNPNDVWTLKWKQKIGITTYRSTLQFFNGKVIIGSNGKSSKAFSDQQDGVYVIHAKSGMIETHIRQNTKADNDVTGIALSHNRIYFGSDNNRFYAYDWEYHKIWEQDLGSDIEAAPSLEDINADGVLDVVVGTEEGRVMILNGQDGQAFWNVLVPYQPSWTYPVERSFMAAPVTIDVNRDGIRDVVVGSRNGSFYAFDGKTGSILWSFRTETPSGIHSSATYTEGKFTVTDSYGYLYQVTKSGRVSLKKSMLGKAAPLFFSSPIQLPNTKTVALARNGAINFTFPSKKTKGFRTHKISASPLIANVVGDEKQEVLFLTENGWLYCFDFEGNIVGRFSLPYGGEATPLIADIDGDSQLELVICTNDGYIACYGLQTNGPVIWGQFRANPYNTGVINDTLIVDADFQMKHSVPKQKNLQQAAYQFDKYQLLKHGGVESDYTIEKDRIGPAKLGMTFGRLKSILGRKIVYKDVNLGIGMKAKSIMWAGHIHFYILYPSWKPLLENTDVISVLATDSARYKTKEGLNPGATIAEGSQLYGPATLTYYKQTSFEELITFKYKPKKIWFARYGQTKAGKYEAEKDFNKTKEYEPNKIIQFIGVR